MHNAEERLHLYREHTFLCRHFQYFVAGNKISLLDDLLALIARLSTPSFRIATVNIESVSISSRPFARGLHHRILQNKHIEPALSSNQYIAAFIYLYVKLIDKFHNQLTEAIDVDIILFTKYTRQNKREYRPFLEPCRHQTQWCRILPTKPGQMKRRLYADHNAVSNVQRTISLTDFLIHLRKP